MVTTWNSSDASANIVLSGGSLTAATNSGTLGGVRATASVSSGKIYIEFVIKVLGGSAFGVGFANSSAPLGNTLGNSNAVGVAVNSIPQLIEINGSSISGTLFSGSTGVPTTCTVCIAFDITNKLIWAKINGGFWNGSSTANPATGTGGSSTSSLAAGPYFPAFGSNSSGASVVANFGATDFNYPVPSGFAGIDSNAQAYVASSKFLGLAVLGPSQSAVTASKLLGLAVLGSSQSAVSVSKLLGYAVLAPGPLWRFQQEWPNPLPERYPIDLKYHDQSVALNLLGQDTFFAGPGNGPDYDWSNPVRPRRFIDDASDLSGPNLNTLGGVVQSPFIQNDWPNPLLESHVVEDGSAYFSLNQNTLGVLTIQPFSQSDWPNPLRKFHVVEEGSIYFSLNQNTLGALTIKPFSQSDWPNPVLDKNPKNVDRVFTSSFSITLTATPTGFGYAYFISGN